MNTHRVYSWDDLKQQLPYFITGDGLEVTAERLGLILDEVSKWAYTQHLDFIQVFHNGKDLLFVFKYSTSLV